MPLPKIGLQAVLENSAGFTKALDTVNKKIEESTKKTKDAAKNSSPLSNALDKVGISYEKIADKISRFTGINREALDGIFEITKAFGPMAVAIGAAAVAAVGLGVAFVALGNRGAPLVGLADSFDRLTAAVGVSSQTLLKDLRQAANGTVSDFDLIRRANTALVGATGEFGKQFGRDLPKLLAAARAASKATGQDVDFLFQSLVTGIKRASPLLIDNTGIVLKVGEANEKLAKSLGKSVEALTAEEKQIAVLNATVESGQRLIDSLGDAQETNAEKLARSQAIITNTLDSLAVAMQPAFGTVLDLVNRVLSGFQQLALGLAPILSAIASIITDILGGAINTVLDIISPIVSAIASFLPYISILFQGIANIIHGVVTVIRNVVGGVVQFVQDVARNLFGLDISNLGKSLFEGAARAFGSFANGIIAVANQLIFPAILFIAKTIADFLVGFSPPKKGPLSQIDKGGENVMKAWLDGIAGVSLDPVEQVAEQVSLALGDIGKASLPAVDARLKELDAALLPFQNRLDIVKSQFDAIAAPAQAALDAIDRQMAAAQNALASGDVQAAETIRRLDAARAAIQGQLDAQQAVVDRQQIQLGLATAAQAQERALLTIRKAQLSVTQKVAAAASTAAGGPKEPKAAGGAGAPELNQPGTAGAGIALPGESSLDLISGQSAVNEAIAGIQDAFAGQIDTSQLAQFQDNQAALQEQFARIGSVDLGAKLKDKFKGFTDLFDSNVEGSPANVVSRFFGPADQEGSVSNFLNNLGPNIEAALPAVKASLEQSFNDLFDPNTAGSPAQIVTDLVYSLTGDQSQADSVAAIFSEMPANISNALSTIYDQIVGAFEGVYNFFTGQGEGLTLQSILDQAVTFFSELPGKIVEALKGLGATIYAAVAIPVITVINSLIEMVEGAIKGFINGIADFVAGIAGGIDSTNLGINTSVLHNIVADLRTKSGSVAFGRISTELPAFLAPSVPAAARGGLFGPGAIDVGELGPERIFAASKVGIIPAQLTTVLRGLESVLAAPAPVPVMGGNSYSNSQQTFNFNGVQSDNDARRRFNALRAGMR